MGVKISNLPSATLPLTGAELVPVVQGGVTAKAQVFDLLSGDTGSASVGFLQSGTGATARTVEAKLRDTVSVKDFGAVGDGVTDDTAAIQAAINSAKTIGRATTVTANGTFKITSTLVVDASNITLQGAGSDTSHDVGSQGAGARATLVWAGSAGGTILRFASPTGASNQACGGGGANNLFFACNNSAAIGLQVLSWRKGTFENLFFENPTTVGVDVGVVASLGEARDTQNCYFRNLGSRQFEVTGGLGGLIRLGGDASANTSLNMFEQLDCSFLNGTAYLLNNSDNNLFIRVRAFRAGGGTGNAIVFNGSNSGAAEVARSNIFLQLSSNGAMPIIMRGTSSFTHPSTDNSALFLDYDNGYTPPTFETGATGQWSDTRGIQARTVQVTAAVGDDITNAIAAQARLGSGSMHVVNGSENHIRLSDAAGTNVWSLSMDGSGNLRVVRISGSANFNLPTTLLYNSAAVSLGAADSGGTGFRVLRVPN